MGGQIDVIYTDLEKAFDKILHQKIVEKLKLFKVNPDIIDWICSFLFNRKMRVRINSKFSSWSNVISWPCCRSRYAIQQHRRISVGTSKHAAALGHCDHQLFRFSKCRSDEPVSENDPSAAQRLQLGTLCLLLSLIVTLFLLLNLG